MSPEHRKSIDEEVERDFSDLRRLSKKVVDKQINDGKGNFLQFLGYLISCMQECSVSVLHNRALSRPCLKN